MPDVDSYDSSSGIAVDVQQRLNCALSSFFFELWFLSIPKSSRHVQEPRMLSGLLDLAVDLFNHCRSSDEFLLRKEVIQPQVPLRLPCYDFIPVTTHSVGGCLLAVSAPASATSDFHDVTGGVYKARERIHGAVADAPLLAIPASWSRVADSNPNWAQF